MADPQTETVSRFSNFINQKKERVFAIIPARGGSKGVHRKNIRLLGGKPLIAYTIEAALHCPGINRCFVSTEDQEINKISLYYGAEVIDRPGELAGDLTLSQDVVRHALELMRREGDYPEYFALLQPTSPFRTAEHLQDCIDKFFSADADCIISVTEIEHHPYKSFSLSNKRLKPFWGKDFLHQPRQQLPEIYRQNGAIYLMKSDTFLCENSFFVEPAIAYIMDQYASIDIDNELDFKIASLLLDKMVKGRGQNEQFNY